MPKILINSVPKSGTNLLIQIVKGIPGIFQDQKVFYHSGNRSELLNIKPGEMVSSHIKYNKIFSRELQSKSIKQVFIYRDLRDVAVSMVHFINDKLHTHPLYPVFQNRLLTFEEQLNALICGIDFNEEEQIFNNYGMVRYPGIFEEYRSIYEWIKDPTVCSIRYEDLRYNEILKGKNILSIINFLWEDLEHLGIDKFHLLNLMKQNINPEKSWTFRQGNVGGWIDEFTVENKKNFKEVTGDFLIQLGYEKDNNW